MFLILAFFQKKKKDYQMFEKYKNYQYLNFDELKMCVNYICSCLNSGGVNYPYFYDMYSYTSKTFIVMSWRKKRGFKERGKLGEAICDNVLVDFLKDKEHFKCSCSSVYYNAVF